MDKVRISRGKFQHLQNCTDQRGILSALAMDQRSSLKKFLMQAGMEHVSDEDLLAFKRTITEVLTPYASALLIDPEQGLGTLSRRAPGTGVLLAYEKSGYDASVKGRLPNLLPFWSVRRLREAGANAIKVLVYFNPFDQESINATKRALVERVGAECAALDIPFFLEPLVYDERYASQGIEFARLKPRYVTATIAEFSQPRYGVDILKVEVPINAAFLAGSLAYTGGEVAYDRQSALEHFRAAAAAARKPFVYLSAGVSDSVFRESLELAAEAGAPFSGVLCGKATWKDGIAIFAQGGPRALEAWLLDRGVRNIQALSETVARTAQPWYTLYGGPDNIDIVDCDAVNGSPVSPAS